MPHEVRAIHEVTGMTVDHIGGPGSPRRPDAADRSGRTERSESRSPAKGDRVELSPQARRVASLAREAMERPEVRRDKVEALRRSIDRGDYRVDPRSLARAILEFEDGLPR